MPRQLIVFGAIAVALGGIASPTPAGVLDDTPSRGNDTQPHFGGAKLDSNPGACTSGFSVRVNGSRQAGSVVAGHCFHDLGEVRLSGDQIYGTITAVRYDTTRDMALMAGEKESPQTYAPTIWTNPGFPAARRVVGARDPLTTDNLCISGAVSGDQCGLTFDPNTKATACTPKEQQPPNICTSNLSVAQRPGAAPAVQPGDSGAPVYTPGDGGVIIVGLFVAGDPSRPGFAAFEPISFVQRELGVTVMVTTP